MGFILFSISFCIGIILEKYWFNTVLFFLYWNTIGKVLAYYCFIFLFVLEKYLD